jgi:hypothetical protein
MRARYCPDHGLALRNCAGPTAVAPLFKAREPKHRLLRGTREDYGCWALNSLIPTDITEQGISRPPLKMEIPSKRYSPQS